MSWRLFLLPILLIALPAHSTGNNDCDGKCTLPEIDFNKDCPEFGFDCHRLHADLGLFHTRSHRSSVTLTLISADNALRCSLNDSIQCSSKQARLFVEGKEQRKLRCDKKIGKWDFGNECKSTKSALCARSCTTCPNVVPGFLSINAVSVSVSPASKESPCATASCDGIGLTLTGIRGSNETVVISGNLTCSGDGWMDSNGVVYRNTVCAYNSCPLPAIAPLSAGTVPYTAIGVRAITCPSGYKLVYGSGTVTYNVLLCGPNGKWQSFGVDIDPSDITQAACTFVDTNCPSTIKLPSPCASDSCIAANIRNLTLGNGVVFPEFYCEDPDYLLDGTVSGTSTTFPISDIISCAAGALETISSVTYQDISCQILQTCSTSFGDLAPVACADNTLCSNAVVTTSSIKCPAGSTLLYGSAIVTASEGNLTCEAGTEFLISNDPHFSINGFKNVTCTSSPYASCRTPRQNLGFEAITFEVPANAQLVDNNLEIVSTLVTNATGAFLSKQTNPGALFYINDGFDKVADTLSCGSDGQYRANDQTVVISASPYFFANCDVPTAPSGTTAASSQITKGYFECTAAQISYVTSDGKVNVIGDPTAASNLIICGPGRQYILKSANVFVFLPAGTQIGCLSF